LTYIVQSKATALALARLNQGAAPNLWHILDLASHDWQPAKPWMRIGIPNCDAMTDGYVIANVTKPMPERRFYCHKKKNYAREM
jgi:hypothetical protein